jgi:peroxiredoxin
MVLLESEDRLRLGERAPGFRLRGVDGREYSLENFRNARALLIVFMCNHCPYVKAKLGTLMGLQERYRERGLVVVGINSNDPTDHPEDSFENMQRVAEEKGFNFLYLHDETQEVARAYGAACTPDPFLFDGEQRLAYHGRLDDALSPDAAPQNHDMEAAIERVLAGEPVGKGFLPSRGCSIKWKA